LNDIILFLNKRNYIYQPYFVHQEIFQKNILNNANLLAIALIDMN